jgi:hypothetical protein
MVRANPAWTRILLIRIHDISQLRVGRNGGSVGQWHSWVKRMPKNHCTHSYQKRCGTQAGIWTTSARASFTNTLRISAMQMRGCCASTQQKTIDLHRATDRNRFQQLTPRVPSHCTQLQVRCGRKDLCLGAYPIDCLLLCHHLYYRQARIDFEHVVRFRAVFSHLSSNCRLPRHCIARIAPESRRGVLLRRGHDGVLELRDASRGHSSREAPRALHFRGWSDEVPPRCRQRYHQRSATVKASAEQNGVYDGQSRPLATE